MAAAAFTTAFLSKDFIMRRDTAFFESLGNKAVHLIGHFLKHFLSGNIGLNPFMSIGLILQVLELADLFRVQFLTTAMTLLQGASQVHDIAIQGHSGLISEKALSLFTGGLDGLIRSDGGTEGFDMGGNGGSKGSCHGPRCYLRNTHCRMKDAFNAQPAAQIHLEVLLKAALSPTIELKYGSSPDCNARITAMAGLGG